MRRRNEKAFMATDAEVKAIQSVRSTNGTAWPQRALNAVFDSAVQAVSPKRYAKRMSWRQNQHLFGQMQSASMHGAMSLWKPTGGDADSDTLEDLPLTRARSHDAALNNPVYIAVQRFMADHVVGQEIKMQSRIDHEKLGVSETQAQDWQGACEDVWEGMKDHADVTGRMTQGKLQRLIYTSYFDGGDAFVLFPFDGGFGSPLSSRMTVIESERVSTPTEFMTDPRVRGGIRVNRWGRPLGYYVSKSHPGDMSLGAQVRSQEWEFFPTHKGPKRRLNIMQVMNMQRVRLSRGVPTLSASLPLIDQISSFVDSTVQAADLQARMSHFIKSNADLDLLAEQITAGTARTGNYEDRTDFGAEQGAYHLLNTNDEIQSVGATHPHAYTDSFVVRLLRLVASELGAPYELVFGDLGSATFSSLRGSLQAFGKVLVCEQDLVIQPLKAYWFHVIQEAWLDGKLPNVPFLDNPQEWARSKAIAPRLAPVDPFKETQSDVLALENNLTTLADVIASRGGDWREISAQRVRENDHLTKIGLKAEAPDTDPDEDEEEEQDDDQKPEDKKKGDEKVKSSLDIDEFGAGVLSIEPVQEGVNT